MGLKVDTGAGGFQGCNGGWLGAFTAPGKPVLKLFVRGAAGWAVGFVIEFL